MAFNETFSTTSGRTIYAQIWRRADGDVWNGSAFAAYLDANWSTYAVAMPEQGTSGTYVSTSPAGIGTTVVYDVLVFAQAGGSAAKSDGPAIGNGTIGPLADAPTINPILTITPIQATIASGAVQQTAVFATLNATMPPLAWSPVSQLGQPITMVGPVKFRLYRINSGVAGSETIIDTITATLSNGNQTATVQVPKTDNAALITYGWTLWDTGNNDQPLAGGTYTIIDGGPSP